MRITGIQGQRFVERFLGTSEITGGDATPSALDERRGIQLVDHARLSLRRRMERCAAGRWRSHRGARRRIRRGRCNSHQRRRLVVARCDTIRCRRRDREIARRVDGRQSRRRRRRAGTATEATLPAVDECAHLALHRLDRLRVLLDRAMQQEDALLDLYTDAAVRVDSSQFAREIVNLRAERAEGVDGCRRRDRH